MLPQSSPSDQLADMEARGHYDGHSSMVHDGSSNSSTNNVGDNNDSSSVGQHLNSGSTSTGLQSADQAHHYSIFQAPAAAGGRSQGGRPPSSHSSIDRPRAAINPLASTSSAILNARSSSSNPSTSSASSSNTISLPSSSHLGGGASASSESSSMAFAESTSRDMPKQVSSASTSKARHASLPPASATAALHGPNPAAGHGLLHPLRVSTRPSTKRASSYTPGLVVSPMQYGSHSTPSSPLQSPLYPPTARPDYQRKSSIDLTSAVAQASSISLPMDGEGAAHQKLEALARQSSITDHAPHVHLPRANFATSSMHDSSPSASAASSSNFLPSPNATRYDYEARPSQQRVPSHLQGDGYEAEREQDHDSQVHDPSPASSHEAPLNLYNSKHHYATAQAGPSSRQHTSSHPPPPLSPRSQAQVLKGKGRSRELSASSGDQPLPKDFTIDDQTDADNDTATDLGTDLASDAGNTTWDVRETDRLRSAKDAYGRRMINQYARVAELGKGVHGKVWLCEDTDTGEFFAIKSVNREDRRNKSLKREQAEATARERALADAEQDDQGNVESEEERRQRLRAQNPNASFDEEMELDEPLPQISRKKSTNAAGRKTMMDEKVKQEIAIMKRIHHPNVVQLREVIDDIRSKKIFMVLEYMPGGQVEWTFNDQPTMTVDETRRVFRDVVLGLEYLHYNGIIHRDIKPANLLWSLDKRTAKISDFGVSHVSEALARSSAANPAGGGRVGMTDDRALRKTEGSPAFFAPELCSAYETTPVGTPMNELSRTASRPDYFRRISGKSGDRPGSSGSGGKLSPMSPMSRMTSSANETSPKATQRNSTGSITTISQPLSNQQQQTHRVRQLERPIVGKGIDVWALGVTLYCLLFGYTPFHEAKTEFELYNMIPKKEIAIPPTMGSDRLPTGSGVDKAIAETDQRYAEGREVVNLLSRLLEKDPTKRIELWEVKRHPWVLRNLENSQGWLQEHDLARRGVVQVTQEEVRQATAERTKPQPPAAGLKAALKRFGETFGFGGNAIRRPADMRDRSKSVSSTSASMTTASGWDGRSETSRAASRQASIVKKKPSNTSNMTASDDLAHANEAQTIDSNLASHALALNRKLASAKAAQSAHDAATLRSSPPEADMPTKPYEHYRTSHTAHQNALSRSLSGQSGDAVENRAPVEAKRRQSLAHLLQPPVALQRRVSSAGAEAASPYGNASHSNSGANASRPSLSSSLSRPLQKENGSDSQRGGGLRNLWNKLRSGSRTPAPTVSYGRAVSTPSRQMTASTNPSSDNSPGPPVLPTMDFRSPGSTRRASAEYIIFSPATSNSRPSSQDTDVDAPASFHAHDTITKDSEAGVEVNRTFTTHRGVPEEAVSDSSESLSDFDDEDEDFGEAISPAGGPNTGEVSQPSSYGQHGGPVMWANASEGWKCNPEMPADPLGRFLRQQQQQQQSADDNSNDDSPLRTRTPTLEDNANLSSDNRLAKSSGSSISKPTTESLDMPSLTPVRSPLFKSDFIPPSLSPELFRRKSGLAKDGYLPRDYTSRPSPARLMGISNFVDPDEDDDGEEVMIKPKSRLRRATNAGSATSSAPPSARPSMPASPRPSFYQGLMSPP